MEASECIYIYAYGPHEASECIYIYAYGPHEKPVFSNFCFSTSLNLGLVNECKLMIARGDSVLISSLIWILSFSLLLSFNTSRAAS